MATAIVTARPSQALRQRRDPQRPGLTRVSTRATTVEAMDSSLPPEPVPHVITEDYILRKFRGKPPSLILHMHQNHFRFDQQDGNFSYKSEMKFILQHIKNRTVPHEMLEELHASNVPFYDNCLIVEIHNHRTAGGGGGASGASATNQVGGTDHKPYSIHNYNEHITPSPYAKFPVKPQSSGKPAVEGEKVVGKDNMPAPEQPASAMHKRPAQTPIVETRVLFSTPMCTLEELSMLARTPYTDNRSYRQGSIGPGAKEAATPTLAHPPTPLASVPPTPLTSKGSSKHPQFVLNEENAHEWEAAIINATAPPLILTPANNMEESWAIIEKLSHPLHSAPPPAPKGRKRTVAEMAADEAHAATEERFMLSSDERHQNSLAGGATGTSAESGARGGTGSSFEANFKRFKLIETLQQQQEEKKKLEAEKETQKAVLKRQQQEADARKARERDAIVAQQNNAMRERQLQQEELIRRQQIQQAAQAAAAQQASQAAMSTPVSAHTQQMPMMPSASQNPMQQASQASQMSPVVRQHTPMSASPILNGTPMNQVAMTSVPMTGSASNQGAGSPPRPASAVQHHGGVGMMRQASHQQSSAQGTPQLHSTPNMASAAPATRHMTPTPRVNQHGSPIPNAGQGTPMMNNPTPGNTMTPEQQQMMNMRRQQMAQAQMAQLQASQQGINQMSPQQMAVLQMQRQAAMGGTPTPQQQNNFQMQQMMNGQQQQMGMRAGGASSPQSMMDAVNRQIQQVMHGVPPQVQQQLNAWRQQTQNTFGQQLNQKKMQFYNQFGVNGNLPPERAQQWSQIENQTKMSWQQSLPKNLMAQRQQLMGIYPQQGGGQAGGQQGGMQQNAMGQQPGQSNQNAMMAQGVQTPGGGQQVYMNQLMHQQHQLKLRQMRQQQIMAQQGGGGNVQMGQPGQNMQQMGMGMNMGQQAMQSMTPQQMMQMQMQMRQMSNMGNVGGGMGGGMM